MTKMTKSSFSLQRKQSSYYGFENLLSVVPLYGFKCYFPFFCTWTATVDRK